MESKRCSASACSNKSAPTSTGGFCSFHAIKEGSSFPGSKSPSTGNASVAKKAAPTKKKAGGGDIFDRLTDTSNFTGMYKERFDEDGNGKGVNMVTSCTAQNDLSDITDRSPADVRGLKAGGKKGSPSGTPTSTRCANSTCSNKSAPTSPGGFCAYHAINEGSSFPGSGKKAAPKKETATAASGKKKAGGGNIFDRLTDTTNYTGVYKERFNEDGTGKGINLVTSHNSKQDLSNLLDRSPADVRGIKK